MKQYIVWLKTEYKRAAIALPGLFIKGIIPLLVFGMILTFAVKKDAYEAYEKGSIGIVAPEDVTSELALKFVESMEAVEQNFSLVRIKKEEMFTLLENKEMIAAVEVPENIIEDTYYGNMVELSMYVPKVMDVNGLVFTEIMKAGVNTLATAQSEIYTTLAIMDKYENNHNGFSAMCLDINKKNLNIYLNREEYFRTRTLSVTENTGYTNYYAAAFFVLLCLLSGLFITGYGKRTDTETKLVNKRLGIPLSLQYLGRGLVISTMLCIPMICYILMLRLPLFSVQIKVTPQMVWLLLGSVALTASYQLIFFTLAENKKSVVLPIVVFTLIFGYVSGCILPNSILPDSIKRIGTLLPFHHLRLLWQDGFSANSRMDTKAIGNVMLGIILFSLLGDLLLWLKQRKYGGKKYGNG